eukprot:gene10252-11306_t
MLKSRKLSQADLRFLKDGQFHIPKFEIIREGYMFKHYSSMWKQWRARYVILTSYSIHIYKNMADFKAFPLETIPIEGLTMTLEELGLDKMKKYCMKLSHPTFFGKKHHFIGCHNADNRDEWMTAILQALTNQRMDEKDRAEVIAFDAPDGGKTKRSQSRSLTDLSIFGLRKSERPKSMELSSLFTTAADASKNGGRHVSRNVRRAKALSLVENINVRNDFFLQ